MPRDRLRSLLDQARARLRDLGSEPEVGSFVCPTCLRLLPESIASQGHYPAEAMNRGLTQTELQCSDCNNAINLEYERAAQDFFTRQWDVAFGPKGGGHLQFKAEVTTENGVLRIRSNGMGTKARRHLEDLMRHAPQPGLTGFHIAEPREEVAKRALLAWSFLGWFRYAGYAYAASPGAVRVRQIILDPTQALPTSLVYTRSGGGELLPLPRPEPLSIILAKSDQPIHEITDIESFLALGMWWGKLVVVLPFANDPEGRSWERLAHVAALGQTTRVREMNLRTAFRTVQPRGLTAEVVVEITETGERLEMTHRFSESEVAEIAAGRSPLRMAPPRSHA
jgi:hypothetical protein